MPGVIRNRDSLDAEDDISDVSPASTARSTPQPNKRARVEAERHGSTEMEDSWILEPPRTVSRDQRHRQRKSPNDRMPQFKPGQLVRISMKNFLTYTAATYHPGPTLNMIIGPNGTGKSSVVCAICIGLDFAPGLLGRSKDLHEFVRHGCDEASVELEIKGQEGRVNPVVRLDFTKEGGKKSFFLNGRSCRAKDIHDVRRSFGIQVDNLCHFLPQDRVVEFSRLSPKDRLRETLRGAAPSHMTDQFDQLKEMASQHNDGLKAEEDKRKVLVNLEQRQNNQRGDVERMRQRNELLESVRFLRLARPIIKAAQASSVKDEAKARYENIGSELNRLNRRLEPALKAVREKEAYAKEVRQTRDARKRLCDNFQKQVEGCARKDKEEEGKHKDCQQEKERIAKDERDLKNAIARAHQRITDLRQQSEVEPLEFDIADYNARMRDKHREALGFKDQIQEVRESGTNRVNEIEERKNWISDAQRRMKGFETQSGRQLEVLSKESPETAQAWKWIQQNRDKLQGTVFGPPVLECSVTDERYTTMLESLFQRNDMLRIVVTDFKDLELLTEQFEKQGLSDVNLINQQAGLDRWKAPLEEGEARRLKLDGWALDFLKGPEPVLASLCDVSRIHATAVFQDEISDAHFKQLEESGLSNWLTAKASYRITRRREYGPEATSTRVVNIPEQARWWSSRPVDEGLQGRLQSEINTWERRIKEMENERGNAKERLARLRSQVEEAEAEEAKIEQEKDEKVQHNKRLEGLPIKIAAEEDKVQECSARVTVLKEEAATAKEKQKNISLSRAQNCIHWTTAIDNVRGAWTNYVTAAIALVEAECDVDSLKAEHAGAEKLLQEKREEGLKAQDEFRQAKQQFKEAKKEWEGNVTRNPGLDVFWTNLPAEQRERTPEELETDIEASQARLEMLHEGDPRTIAEFEERARRIEKLQEEITTMREEVGDLGRKIGQVKSQWEPELDALVAKISDAFSVSFEKINCLGSVEVGKSTDTFGAQNGTVQAEEDVAGAGSEGAARTQTYDFENWTIEIRVSFREGEALSVLDSHRQSGGERAVSTIYYLMALQALSQAPFRVVDEINQGMDPRNERIVHERMVDIACNGGIGREQEEGGSQYFLITPKLLQGLKYDERMKVHNVVSGEFMPRAEGTEGEGLNLARMVRKMQAMRESDGQRRDSGFADRASPIASVGRSTRVA